MKTKMILCGLLLFLLTGCTDSNGARKALSDQGYTNIQITGYSLFDCGEEDTFRTGFTANSSAGKPVKGVVCSGVTKTSTIRTF